MPCMPPSFRDPDVYSEEILNLNYAVDDGRFKYSSKLEEQIRVQALPVRGLNSKLRKGLKLSIAFKKPHLKITTTRCLYVRDLASSLRFPTKSDLTFRWST
jgi:hypothetical protein